MFELLSGYDVWVLFSLFLALLFVLSFEFINGFHDTANAVATVIYTKAMPAYRAVILSGCFNFLGVLLGGVGVAYAIVHLLPVELLINVNSGHGMAMVFGMLGTAIIWNLGTWYFGIPCSSSHTLIGSILGVGLGNSLLNNISLDEGVNWSKAIDIAMSLLISPMVGFCLAAMLFLSLKFVFPKGKMHSTPEQRKQEKGKNKPPFWTRLVLVLSSMTISFVHGSNDGQKGVGLIMLTLTCIVPGIFVVNMHSSAYQIERTFNAVQGLESFYHRNNDAVIDLISTNQSHNQLTNAKCVPAQNNDRINVVKSLFQHPNNSDELITNFKQLDEKKRIALRSNLLCLDDIAKKVAKNAELSNKAKSDLNRLRKDLRSSTEYAPLWVVIAVALALGSGTMIGWKRVVVTVGEKIGKQGMTYSQGMCAEITTSAAIAMANLFSLPVSTTHVLSSGVAGTMIANKIGLQGNTVRTILLAWCLTLPITIIISAALFYGLAHILG